MAQVNETLTSIQVGNPLTQQLKQPLVTDVIEKSAYVRVTDPVHFLRADDLTEHLECVVAGMTWAEAERNIAEVRFVDSLQDHHDRSLNDLVFHGSNPQRTRLAIPFRNVATQTG